MNNETKSDDTKMKKLSKSNSAGNLLIEAEGENLLDLEEDQYKYIKLQIIIEDNGVGISPENLEKLFTDFNKLDEHKKMNFKGTGLGLSICKLIVDQMGGFVEVKSEGRGKGSQFIITLHPRVIDKIIIKPDT